MKKSDVIVLRKVMMEDLAYKDILFKKTEEIMPLLEKLGDDNPELEKYRKYLIVLQERMANQTLKIAKTIQSLIV